VNRTSMSREGRIFKTEVHIEERHQEKSLTQEIKSNDCAEMEGKN
jgi:hypothetical protein